MELVGCLETSVRNYHFPLREVPEDPRSHLYRSISPNSRTRKLVLESNPPSIKWVLEVPSLGVKQPESETKNSYPFTFEFDE
jgi:hypothetical protein